MTEKSPFKTVKDEQRIVRISPLVLAKVQRLMREISTEVGGFMVSDAKDPLALVDVAVLEQEAAGARTEPKEEAIIEWLDKQTQAGKEPWQVGRVWWHTHPGFQSVPSQTDWTTFEESFGGCSWSLMVVVGQKGALESWTAYQSISDGKVRWVLPIKVVLDWSLMEIEGLKEWVDEARSKIRPMTYGGGATSIVGFSQGRGGATTTSPGSASSEWPWENPWKPEEWKDQKEPVLLQEKVVWPLRIWPQYNQEKTEARLVWVPEGLGCKGATIEKDGILVELCVREGTGPWRMAFRDTERVREVLVQELGFWVRQDKICHQDRMDLLTMAPWRDPLWIKWIEPARQAAMQGRAGSWEQSKTGYLGGLLPVDETVLGRWFQEEFSCPDCRKDKRRRCTFRAGSWFAFGGKCPYCGDSLTVTYGSLKSQGFLEMLRIVRGWMSSGQIRAEDVRRWMQKALTADGIDRSMPDLSHKILERALDRLLSKEV